MIKPSNAASIWLSDGKIFLELPGIGKTSHQVTFPANSKGLSAAISTLSARVEQSLIGTPGDPTQHNIEQLLKASGKPVQRTKRKYDASLLKSADEILKQMGMIK